MDNRDKLKNDIEVALHRQMKTPKDFDFLSERIYARLHTMVSRTTLMRMWGYVDESVEPRESTLDLLAQFLGYRHWKEYNDKALLPKEQQSNPVMSRRLSVKEGLNNGDCLRLTWQPDRTCDVKYLGCLKFTATASENTRLQPGDTFECSMIIEGEPLYLDNLRQGEKPAIAYVCGKKSGVMFEFV